LTTSIGNLTVANDRFTCSTTCRQVKLHLRPSNLQLTPSTF